MARQKKYKGFTLVEMLVVIAIIAILAAALFPAITSAMNQARATAMKNKGRGIWLAITSANMEREPLGFPSLWPKELEDSENINTSVDYFNYLLSDGDNKNTIVRDADARLVSDLTPEALIVQGVPVANTASLSDENIAWHVGVVSDITPGEMPFLFSKNLSSTHTTIQGATGDDDSTRLTLDPEAKPFGNARAVWVNKGGGIFDARPRYMYTKVVVGIMTNEVDVWHTAQE